MPTLALDGLAPIAVSFVSANDTDRGGVDCSPSPAAPAATAGGSGGGTLHANLQTCSSTDTSASNGVLHVLSFLAEDDDIDDRSVSGGGGSDGDGSGVMVPDVLELAHAFGFRKTYEAIVTASSGRSGFAPTAAVEAGGTGAVPTTGGTAGEQRVGATTVADALRGPAAHTLLAVGDSRLGNSPVCLDATAGDVVAKRVGVSVDTLR